MYRTFSIREGNGTKAKLKWSLVFRFVVSRGGVAINHWAKVRVKPAPKSSAGKTLSTADVPPEEWKTFGLMIPMPEVCP